MEPKKNPKYDVHRKSGMLFSFSLGCSLLIVITAFEWETKVSNEPTTGGGSKKTLDDFYYAPASVIDAPAASVAPKPKVIRMINPDKLVTSTNTEAPDVETPAIEIAPIPGHDIPSIKIEIDEEEKITSPFTWVEEMPIPENGYEGFYNQLSKNLKYPVKARRMDTQGRVYIQFIVNEKGEISNIEIVKGIGNGCDEEAMRVLALTKWKPGKQRGRPVKVKMVQTIIFTLNTY